MGNFVHRESESDGRYWDLFTMFTNTASVRAFKISNFVIRSFVYCLFYISLHN